MNWRPLLGAAAILGLSVVALQPASSQARPVAKNGEIAFSYPKHDGASQVFTVEPNGSRLRQVTHGPLSAGQYGLSWSPDGSGLLYAAGHPNGPDAVVRSHADGSGATAISPPCTGTCLGDDNPDYSPDGKHIAFERAFGPVVNDNASGGVAIFTMGANGSDLRQLTPKGTSENHQPRWSPDGKSIAFVHFDKATNKGAIEVMNADGSNVRRLTPFGIDASDPRWSPDGKHLLFNDYADPVSNRSSNLFTMRADGTHRVALTHYAGGTLQARADDWSPDGRQIVFRRLAFSGTDTEVGGFYIFDIRTKHIRRLTPARIRYDALAAWGRAG